MTFYHSISMERVFGERAKALEDFVVCGIVAFNEEKCGIQSNYEPIDIEIRNSAGELVAGVHAESYLDVTMVHILFAAERGKGHGQKLMQEIERISRAAGRRHIILDSFSFQAPDFYKQKLGFEEFGVVNDHTPGFKRHFLVKHLI